MVNKRTLLNVFLFIDLIRAIRIDIKFDYATFNKYFELIDGGELIDAE